MNLSDWDNILSRLKNEKLLSKNDYNSLRRGKTVEESLTGTKLSPRKIDAFIYHTSTLQLSSDCSTIVVAAKDNTIRILTLVKETNDYKEH